MKSNTKELFPVEETLMDSPRLLRIKEHDIQTHHAPHSDIFDNTPDEEPVGLPPSNS